MKARVKLYGAWILLDEKGNETNLYTKRAFDYYINRATNAKYTRGEWKIVRDQDPPLIDKDPRFKFVMNDRGTGLSLKELVKESIFKK